jgi:16S rRNA (cytosine967-C5)-methyltransferase
LRDIDEKGSYANLALARLPEKLSARDRALATELVAGPTRMRRLLDYVLDRISSRPVADLKPAIRNILRLGAYQVLFLTRIPARAALHESVELARKHGHEGVARLTNAVLRKVSTSDLDEVAWPDDPIERIAVRHSYPDWLIAAWAAEYGIAEAEQLAERQNQPLSLALRVNITKLQRDDLLQRLELAGIRAEPSPVVADAVRVFDAPPIARIPGYMEGWWYVQGEAAMLAAIALDPRPGETIADIGAAPGGKTTHLAERMGNRGTVLAVESHAGRLKLVEDNAKRLGLTCIRPLERSGEEPLGTSVDRALVDAPCSGLGTLYRKADLRWRMTPAEQAELPALQARLLEAAASAVEPGGALLYATCTTLGSENRDVAAGFVAKHPEFAFGVLREALPEQWRAESDGGMIQLLPHRHGTEGFFLARFDRRESG